MKQVYKISLLILIIISVNSCKESFLDQEYKNALVDTNFLTTPAQAEAATIGMYDVLGFEGQYDLARLILGSSTADEVVEEHGDYGRVGTGMIELDKYTWHASSRYILDHWYSSYKGIGRANYIIKKTGDIDNLDENLAERYIAEAKALRALFYYNLVTCFGDIPLILEPIGLEEAKAMTRTPTSEIWDQIIKDLNEAIGVLPNSYDAANAGRATKGFANGLLSRVYLWTKEFDKAESTAKAVINSPANYGLLLNYSDNFNGLIENGQESILEVMNASGSSEENIWTTEASEVNRMIYWGPIFSWSHFYQPSRDFIDNMFESGDLRREFSILDMAAGEKYDINNDGDDSDEIPTNPPVEAHIMKWVPANTNLLDGSVWSGGIQNVNMNILRYSEILLNCAEALNEQGKQTEALTYLNQVRQRAGLDDVTTTDKDELDDILLHERAVEFCFEGHRFFDLKRKGKLTEVLGALGFITGTNELFPIPQSEIDYSKMEQNPGYY